jgi:hypothetical protein
MKRHVVGACILLGLFHPEMTLHASTLISAPAPDTAKSTVIYEQRKLTATDGQSPDRFGHALDVSGSFALIGAAPDDAPADRPEREAAYVFERVGDGWIERRRLAPPNDGQVRGFGRAVAIDGDTAVVGAPREAGANGPRAGAVHVYVRNAGEWTLQARLVAPDGGGNDRFGAAVAAEGNVIVVGAPWAQVEPAGGAGAAYVFVRQGSTWSAMARLTAPAGFSGDEFGFAVAVSGDAVLVGAPDAGPQSASQNGLAYVFARQGDSWAIDQTLVAPDAANGSLFGHAVALDGDRALVGAYAANGNALRSGAAYVFRREAGRWQFEQAMAPASAQQGAWLGDAVALDGHQALIGAPGDIFESGHGRGSAYAYLRAGQRWTLQSRLLASDGLGSTGFGGDHFGAAVALVGGQRLASAPSASIEGRWAQGAAYSFAPASPYALSVSEIRVPRSGIREAQIALAGDPLRGANFQLCVDGARLIVGTAVVPAGLAGLSCVTGAQFCPGGSLVGLRCSGNASGADWTLPQTIRVPLSAVNGGLTGSTLLRLLGTTTFETSTAGSVTPTLIDGRAEVARYAVGGLLSGLEPGRLIRLRNTANDSAIMLAANGAFALPTLASTGNSYNVQIATVPRDQSCLISSESGTVADADIEQIRVRCFPGTFGLTASAPATLQRGQTASLSVQLQGQGVATGRFDLCVDAARLTLGSVTVPGGLSGLNCSSAAAQCPTGSTGLRCSGTAAGGAWNLPQTVSIALSARADATLGSTLISIANAALADSTGATLPAPVTNAPVQISGSLRVGGTVTGLSTGAQLVLRNTSTNESLTVGANGSFAFVNSQFPGATFDVRVGTQPANQACVVTGGTGTLVDRDITSIRVACQNTQHSLSVTAAEVSPGGSTSAIVRMTGTGVAGISFRLCFDNRVIAVPPHTICIPTTNGCPLQNGVRCLAVAPINVFPSTFDIPIRLDARPNTRLGTNPLEFSEVELWNVEGDIFPHSTADGTLLIRTPDAFPVGGTLSGLAGGRMLRLTNTATGENLILGNGPWVFSTWQRTGQGYQVSASAQPIGQLCAVTNGSGTVGSGPIENVNVVCPAPAIFTSQPTTGSPIDFGDVVLGSAVERTVMLQNSAAAGGMSLQVTECTISGAGGFSIRQPEFPATLAANTVLPLQIEFRSQRYAVEPRVAQLRCTTESAGTVTEAEWTLRARTVPDIFASGFEGPP